MRGADAISTPPSPVDLATLAAWMDTQRLGTGPIEDAALLTGGTQNFLMRFSRGGRSFILRRPPANPRPQSNRIMEREIRLLQALSVTDVPHPALIAGCTDPAILGATFYLMEPVEGFNPTVAMPQAARVDPAIRRRVGLGIADGLAALAMVDPAAAGLGDFGNPEGFLARQVGRWASELDAYARFEGWAGAGPLGDVAAVGRWLDANLPQTTRVGIIHGDYHAGNVICADDGALLAIVDWEMATLGDPLVDLGRLLTSWPDDRGALPFTMRVDPLDGFPTRAEMIASYAERTGRDMADLPWFEVLACYKMGIIFEGTHARSQAGLADATTGGRLHEAAVALLDEARRIIDNS